MLLLFGITVTVAAQAYDPVPMAHTPVNQPENNPYYRAIQNTGYNEMYRSYWVWDKASVTWVKRVEPLVPIQYAPVLNPDPRYKINNNGNDVCKNNACVIRTQPGGQ